MTSRTPRGGEAGTPVPGGRASDAPELVASTEQRYFLAIEEHFVRLRGAPMMLAPADWQVARGWLELGVPVEIVHRVIDRLFEQRRERAAKGRVQGLRYFDDAVRAAWAEVLELRGPEGPNAPPVELDVAARLRALTTRLPNAMPDREAWETRILGLVGEEPAAAEVALAGLDRELLGAARRWLAVQALAAERAEVGKALDNLRGRLDAQGLADTRERLLDRRLRERFELPELTLFAPSRRD